ncbi:hypothetical protein AJ80_09530 [Polytolypa hystricis UAMH7299]|uniref:Uncharacterized protein n=1 Tax=Polytolypa hystricis (strain UAMH7299) TaxID=1447883 RepID=A0A2B7WPJ1_POLH7|nr:hypothetical protein AJ80_09530 [Polytolypa hystricis UAMH7299]
MTDRMADMVVLCPMHGCPMQHFNPDGEGLNVGNSWSNDSLIQPEGTTLLMQENQPSCLPEHIFTMKAKGGRAPQLQTRWLDASPARWFAQQRENSGGELGHVNNRNQVDYIIHRPALKREIDL